MIKYRKTKTSEWVVFGPISELKVGIVDVVTKNGKSKIEEVEKIGKPFDVEGVPHAYGYLRNGKNETCEECGRVGTVATLPDSSGILGRVCKSCAMESQYDRSYC